MLCVISSTTTKVVDVDTFWNYIVITITLTLTSTSSYKNIVGAIPVPVGTFDGTLHLASTLWCKRKKRDPNPSLLCVECTRACGSHDCVTRQSSVASSIDGTTLFYREAAVRYCFLVVGGGDCESGHSRRKIKLRVGLPYVRYVHNDDEHLSNVDGRSVRQFHPGSHRPPPPPTTLPVTSLATKPPTA